MTERERQNARLAALRESLGYSTPTTPAPRKTKAAGGSYPAPTAAYMADHTVQILTVGQDHPSENLRVHEARSPSDLTPLCGQRTDPWYGIPTEYVDQGRALVTCERCWICQEASTR